MSVPLASGLSAYLRIITSYRRKMRTFNLIISQKKKIIEYEN